MHLCRRNNHNIHHSILLGTYGLAVTRFLFSSSLSRVLFCCKQHQLYRIACSFFVARLSLLLCQLLGQLHIDRCSCRCRTLQLSQSLVAGTVPRRRCCAPSLLSLSLSLAAAVATSCHVSATAASESVLLRLELLRLSRGRSLGRVTAGARVGAVLLPSFVAAAVSRPHGTAASLFQIRLHVNWLLFSLSRVILHSTNYSSYRCTATPPVLAHIISLRFSFFSFASYSDNCTLPALSCPLSRVFVFFC